MVNIGRYKWPIISIIVIIAVLLIMIAVGFTIGVLSKDPDGLERVVMDQKGESWLEHLESPWVPIFSWITSDYAAGIIGILISIAIMTSIFYLIIHYKKKESINSRK